MQKTAQLKVLPVGVLKAGRIQSTEETETGDKEYEKIKNSITEFGFADPPCGQCRHDDHRRPPEIILCD